jgi:hypothetical protein
VVSSGAPLAVLFNPSKDQTTKSTFLSNALRIPKEQHVDEDDSGALVKRYWLGKTEILGEKTATVPLCPSQIPYGLAWD